MTEAELRAALRGLPLMSRVEHHAAIGSTNDRARELAQAGVPEIALIAADEQRSGRGRQNRSWFTPPGTALALSLLTRPAIDARHAMRLTMLAGLAAVEGVEQATGLRLDLKWPNDVVALSSGPASRTRKVGGILTEASFQGDRLEYAVIGLGLNVNVDFSGQAELQTMATSLKHVIGHDIDRLSVLQAIVAAFVARYAWLADGERLRDAWAARLINLGREIRVQLDNTIIAGRSDDVDVDGALLLRTADGQLQRLLAGDVTLHGL